MHIYKKFGLFIDGKWRPAGDLETSPVISPVTETTLGNVPVSTIADTKAAIVSAERGFSAWRSTPAFKRADALHKITDELTSRYDEAAKMISIETGKPIAQSGREWGLVVDQFRWHAEEARRIYGRIIESRIPGGRFEVHHEPIGVVAAFTAWNFPALLIARKVAPALAAGCSVVLRPSSKTPGVAMILVDCLRAGNLPNGTINLVIGPIANTYTPIMASKSVRKLSLTGSTRVGQKMIRDSADTIKKITMELGGNAPMIVFDDANLEATLDAAVATKFANCGQVCVTLDRIFVHENLYSAFVKGFAARAKELILGDGLDPKVQMGPLIDARSLKAAESVISETIANGATLVTGGQKPAHLNTGHFLQPTVFSDVSDTSRVFSEENFAPIAAITKFSEDDDVFSRANASDMGLSAYVFTSSSARAKRAIAELNTGMVGINSFALAASEAPFGGTNFSGYGREGGLEGIKDYLNTKLAQVVL
jgi:succinate-semialdehyde dehydrogenase/glutarate-semialdehyde dehydrogenase